MTDATNSTAHPGARSASPRIGEPPPRRLPIWVRLLWRLQARRHGNVLGPTRAWSHAPVAMRGFLHFVSAVDRARSPLPPALRSLIMVKVSQVNRCSFCVDMNLSKLQERQVSERKIAALGSYRESALFSDRERAALDYAVAMSQTGTPVDDALFTRLRELFDETAIVELTALVAMQNASSRFNAALAIPPQGFCPVDLARSAEPAADAR